MLTLSHESLMAALSLRPDETVLLRQAICIAIERGGDFAALEAERILNRMVWTKIAQLTSGDTSFRFNIQNAHINAYRLHGKEQSARLHDSRRGRTTVGAFPGNGDAANPYSYSGLDAVEAVGV